MKDRKAQLIPKGKNENFPKMWQANALNLQLVGNVDTKLNRSV